jgi:hypothetical protein
MSCPPHPLQWRALPVSVLRPLLKVVNDQCNVMKSIGLHSTRSRSASQLWLLSGGSEHAAFARGVRGDGFRPPGVPPEGGP